MQAGLISPSLVCCPSATRLHAELIQKCVFAFVYALSYAATVCVCVCVLFQGDGREEVVACAWDGQTYIIDHNRTVVRFQFDENVNAFCAGEGRHTTSSLFLLRRRFSVTVTTLDKFSANATTRHSELSNSRSKSAALSNL